ncbi:MAG: DoxX family protein [Gemmatimonadaceae bacterium]|jgi:uncharacterized membrane protein YphA (DoxX/SURF4 family)
MKPTSRLWTVQIVLAALFLFAGVMKLLMPAAALEAQAHMPALFLKFIGVCEVLGAIGVIVPWLTGIHRQLTPVAAAGLVVIMIGATVISAAQGPAVGAIVPAVVGLLAAYVVRGRWETASRRTLVSLSPTTLRRAA